MEADEVEGAIVAGRVRLESGMGRGGGEETGEGI